VLCAAMCDTAAMCYVLCAAMCYVLCAMCCYVLCERRSGHRVRDGVHTCERRSAHDIAPECYVLCPLGCYVMSTPSLSRCYVMCTPSLSRLLAVTPSLSRLLSVTTLRPGSLALPSTNVTAGAARCGWGQGVGREGGEGVEKKHCHPRT